VRDRAGRRDLRRIQSVGFSAGATHDTQLGWLRSGYVASIVNCSGAQLGDPANQDPEDLFPARPRGGRSPVGGSGARDRCFPVMREDLVRQQDEETP